MSGEGLAGFFGKLFRKKKDLEVPGMSECDVCGKVIPDEDLHKVIMSGGDKCDLRVCEECSEKPPSSWRKQSGK